MNALPSDPLTHTFSFLTPKELCTIAPVCKQWNTLISKDPRWKLLVAKHFPHTTRLEPQKTYLNLASGKVFLGKHTHTTALHTTETITSLLTFQNWLIGGAASGSVEFWDLPTFAHLNCIEACQHPIVGLAAEGETLVILAQRSITLWNLTTWENTFSLGCGDHQLSLALAQNHLICGSTRALRLFSLAPPGVKQGPLVTNQQTLALHPTGEYVICTTYDALEIRTQNTLALRKHVPLKNTFSSCLTNGTLFTGHIDSINEWSTSLQHLRTFTQRGFFLFRNRIVSSIHVRGNSLLTRSSDDSLHIWDRTTATLATSINTKRSLFHSCLGEVPEAITSLSLWEGTLILGQKGAIEIWRFDT